LRSAALLYLVSNGMSEMDPAQEPLNPGTPESGGDVADVPGTLSVAGTIWPCRLLNDRKPEPDQVPA